MQEKREVLSKEIVLVKKKCLSTKSNIVENSTKFPTFRSSFSSMGAYRAHIVYSRSWYYNFCFYIIKKSFL